MGEVDDDIKEKVEKQVGDIEVEKAMDQIEDDTKAKKADDEHTMGRVKREMMGNIQMYI